MITSNAKTVFEIFTTHPIATSRPDLVIEFIRLLFGHWNMGIYKPVNHAQQRMLCCRVSLKTVDGRVGRKRVSTLVNMFEGTVLTGATVIPCEITAQHHAYYAHFAFALSEPVTLVHGTWNDLHPNTMEAIPPDVQRLADYGWLPWQQKVQGS